ncbi:MAG: hypothetical protein Q4C87_00555 [Actinomycetaceae bacterium]|nr:hypothetical protein [Actinomycetaceae bacterium]
MASATIHCGPALVPYDAAFSVSWYSLHAAWTTVTLTALALPSERHPE